MDVERLLRAPLSLLRTVVPDALRRSYALKFGLAILLVALVVGVTGAVATTEFAGVTQETAGENYAATAHQEAETMSDWHSQRQMQLELVAGSSAANGEEIDQRELSSFVGTFRDDIEAIEAIHVVDADGTVRGSSSPVVGGQLTAEQAPWVEQLEAGAPKAMRRSSVYEQDETQLMAFLRPVTGHDDRWVVITYDIGTYSDTLSGRLMPGESFTVVVDRSDDDTIIAHGRNESRIGTRYGHQSLLNEIDGLQVGDRQYRDGVAPIDGLTDEETVVGLSRVGNTDLVVFVHGPTDDAYGIANTVEQWGLIATLLGVLLIGGVGAVLGLSTSRSIDRLTGKAEQITQGNLDVGFETGRIDNIGQLYGAFGSMQTALREQIQEAEQARQDAEDERERAQQERERVEQLNEQLEAEREQITALNDELESAAQEYCEVMGAASDGDLTVRAEVRTDHDAMRTIGEEFNEMLAEIDGTITRLKQFSRSVATASEEVTASSEEVRTSSEQVSESVEEIESGASRQHDSLQSVTQEMEGLSTTTEEIAASSDQVADTAQRTVETSQEGREAAQEAIAGINEVRAEANRSVEEIEALEHEVEQIDDLIASIAEIAEQTSILALNANIEAARAGETGGDGFTVVAQEVKALSEETKTAADEIETRLERIKGQTDDSVEAVQETSETISEQIAVVEQALAALDDIAEYAEETNAGIQEISTVTGEQAASTEEVVSMVEEATTIAEETTSEAETVATAAREQTTAMTEVSESASDLTGQATQLSEALDRFDTSDSPQDSQQKALPQED